MNDEVNFEIDVPIVSGRSDRHRRLLDCSTQFAIRHQNIGGSLMTQHQTETMQALNTDITVVYIHKGESPVPMGQTNSALRQFLRGNRCWLQRQRFFA